MWRLKKCCLAVPLRLGCVFIALFDICINVIVLVFGGEYFIYHVERAVAICHVIGCVLLLFGAIVKSNICLNFYLITSFINTILIIVYSITVVVKRNKNAEFILISCFLLVCIDIYFWIVVFSYHLTLSDHDEDDQY